MSTNVIKIIHLNIWLHTATISGWNVNCYYEIAHTLLSSIIHIYVCVVRKERYLLVKILIAISFM